MNNARLLLTLDSDFVALIFFLYLACFVAMMTNGLCQYSSYLLIPEKSNPS